MPTISMFYGIIVRLFFMDSQQHHRPHVHVEYQGQKAVIGIPEGELIDGNIPFKKPKLVQAWISIHEDELMADWALAMAGETAFPIDPLR